MLSKRNKRLNMIFHLLEILEKAKLMTKSRPMAANR